MKPRVALAGGLDAAAEALLDARADVMRVADWSEANLCRAVSDCEALIVRTFVPVTRRVIEAGRRLRVVGVAGVGTDRIDVDAARAQGVTVLNMADAASDAVAEFTVTLMLELLRPISRLAAAYRAGDFETARKAPHGVELRDLTIGIIGLGRIGSRVGRICAAGIGANVVYCDVVEKGPLDFAAKPVRFSELLAVADVVTLHVPLDDSTRQMLGAAQFAIMKQGARLVNTARGEVVHTGALAAALASGRLNGAALDVTDPEPLPTDHALFSMTNCILTPHVASRTFAGMRRMNEIAARVLDFLSALDAK